MEILKNFIVFEGIDGAGTSTQIKKLVESDPLKFVATAEPTEGSTGKFLRQMLRGTFKLDERTNSFLFAADRCQHIYGDNGIIAMLDKGKSVVSDRYLFSSLAYQSVSCGEKLPKLLNSTFPLPEYLFFFEIDPKISLSRVNSRNENKEIYEKLELQIKIAKEYEKIIEEYENNPEAKEMKIIRLDAEKSIEEVFSFIKKSLN